MPKLSILIPLYNEEDFVGTLLRRVLDAPLPSGMDRELIVVDDGSRDRSAAIVEEFARQYPDRVRLIRHSQNKGKGAAIVTAIAHARGEFSIIQDADLEYDPREYRKMLRPMLSGRADAVYGSRFLTSGERRVLYYWHSVANWLLTTLCNIVADLNLTDMETCYKAFRTSLVQSIPLRSQRFGIEPEITIKLARRHARVYETNVSYHGRTYEEGKKIGLRDAVEAVFVMLKFAWTRDLYYTSGPETLDALALAPRFNRWMADVIRPYVGEVVMEVGAGIGNLTRLLVPGRRVYVGADIDDQHLQRLGRLFENRPAFKAHPCDLNLSQDFQGFAEQMDTVVCLNVLEHVENDAAGLANIACVLKPGGRAIILVPCGQEIYGTLDKALGHYRRYSPEELKTKMEKAGFFVERILQFNRISRPAWFLSGRVFKRTALSGGQMWLFDRFVWLWRRIDKVLPWKPTSIIAIGIKQGPEQRAADRSRPAIATPAEGAYPYVRE
jgi:glycosyltransferase involved in cell wall biosynthesis